MGSVDIQDILRLLAPGTGQNILWSIFLYIIFFFALITLFLMPDKNMLPTLLTAVVLLFAVIAKVSLVSAQPILARKEFGMLIINITMGVVPFIVAGMIRTRSQKSKATVPSIFTGIIGTVYFFLFWFFVQQR